MDKFQPQYLWTVVFSPLPPFLEFYPILPILYVAAVPGDARHTGIFFYKQTTTKNLNFTAILLCLPLSVFFFLSFFKANIQNDVALNAFGYLCSWWREINI